MDHRHTAVDSIYERYLVDEDTSAASSSSSSTLAAAAGATHGRVRESSVPSVSTTEHLSLAPPMPGSALGGPAAAARSSSLTGPGAAARARSGRANANANNPLSTVDTASVYTTATTPYERWSLEQGLESRHSPQAQHADSPFLPSTQRHPDSPSLSQLRNIASREHLPRLNTSNTTPLLAQQPVQTSPSPITSAQPRRHFSRPFRPSEALGASKGRVDSDEDDDHDARTSPARAGPAAGSRPNFTTPIITVAHHRFSASTPDAYEGASFSPAIGAAAGKGPESETAIELDNASQRSSTYSNDIARFPDPTHLRRRSAPTNSIFEGPILAGSAAAASNNTARSSMQTVREALANRHIHRNSLANLSVIESVDEEFSEKPKEKAARPFSPSNGYPFTSNQNAFSDRQSRAPNHKPSSRFSEDEKRGFQTLSENNDYQASAWNLFGRSPAPLSPRWGGGMSEYNNAKNGGKSSGPNAQKKRRTRRIILIVVIVLLILALAGAGAGIGIWRNNVAKTNASSDAVKAKDKGTDGSTSVDAPTATGDDVNTSQPTSTSGATLPVVSTSPGAGGAGGYLAMVSFGGSYTDNGHARVDGLVSTLKGPPYYQGRSSNGPVFSDYLAGLVGPQNNATGAANAVAFNYAYSGAFINNSVTAAPLPDLGTQVSSYLGDLNNGNATVTATALNKTLVVLWAGMEQLVTVWQAAMGTNPDSVQATAQTGVDTMLSTVSNALGWLIPAANSTTQAKPDFAIVTLPQGNLVPEIAYLANYNSDYISVFRNLTDYYNQGLNNLAKVLGSTTVYNLNGESYINKIISSPSTYNLTNTNSSCLAISCSDPSGYLWYDGINPTTSVHKKIAERLASAILKSA